MTMIQDKAIVLFQGDSLTDHGRDRSNPTDLGAGYAMMAAAWFSLMYPEKHVTFFNRGISGDRVTDLVQRWDDDCLALAPNWVSIMIGINNTWRRYDDNEITSAEDFERDYRSLLKRAQETINPQFILCDPFVLPVSEAQKRWWPDLDEKIEIVHRLANDFNAIIVPLNKMFAEAGKKREASFWLYDGVHATPAGGALIAQAWLKAVEAL